MMSLKTKESLQAMEKAIAGYKQEWEGLSWEQITRKPSEDDWSIGQMYMHLIGTTLHMQVRNIELCRAGSGENVVLEGEKTEVGSLSMSQGQFPPIRIHVPASPQYTPSQPESKEQVLQGLITVMERLAEIEPALDDIPANRTVAHPRLGYLNAEEWFLLVEMHFRHHLLQLERLKAAV